MNIENKNRSRRTFVSLMYGLFEMLLLIQASFLYSNFELFEKLWNDLNKCIVITVTSISRYWLQSTCVDWTNVCFVSLTWFEILRSPLGIHYKIIYVVSKWTDEHRSSILDQRLDSELTILHTVSILWYYRSSRTATEVLCDVVAIAACPNFLYIVIVRNVTLFFSRKRSAKTSRFLFLFDFWKIETEYLNGFEVI